MPAMRKTYLLASALLIASFPAAAQSQPNAVDQQPAPVAPSLPDEARDAALLQRVQAIFAAAPGGTRFGLLVETLDGRSVLSVAPDQRFMPASNTKIFTTAATYAQLAALQGSAQGTGVRLERGRHGVTDVVLEGRGDPALSSAKDCTQDCLSTLADAVASRTRKVRDVIGDDSFYPDERWSPGMSWNNIPFRSGTGISALTLDDNEFDLTLTPAGAGKPPALAADGYYTIQNDAVTVAGSASAVDLWRMPGSDVLRVSGTVGADSKPEHFRLGIDDPARYAAFRLRQMLLARGVKVTGTVAVRHRPLAPIDDPETRGSAPIPREPVEPMLAQLPPPSLADDVKLTNKVSQNLHAELALRRLGKLSGTGSIADGAVAVSAMLSAAGVSPGAYIFADGSGMSSYNRVTPRTAVRLLRWIAQQPWGDAWRTTLPVGSVDGTLEHRFNGTLLDGRINAKTGSLNASRALSGYLPGASGQTLVFSVFANDIPPDAEGEAIAAMDAALVAIAAAN